MKMLTPKGLMPVRTLMGGVSNYRKCFRDPSIRLRPINSLHRKDAKLSFKPGMETIVREVLAELGAPSILVFPDFDAIADSSLSFLPY